MNDGRADPREQVKLVPLSIWLLQTRADDLVISGPDWSKAGHAKSLWSIGSYRKLAVWLADRTTDCLTDLQMTIRRLAHEMAPYLRFGPQL